jgi:glucokinase
MAEIYASVDLGGTNLKCALAGADGKVIADRSTPTESHEGPQAVLERMGELVNGLSDEAGCRPAAVGMGVPGLANLRDGITLFLPNLPTQWREVPVRDILQPKVDCPVYLLNDVRMATLGELTFGHGADREAPTMAFFALGTGIGGGVVVDGKLRLGPLGAAGELGHQTVLPDGPLCGCGNHGCMEALASAPALVGEGVRLMRAGLASGLHDLVDGDDSRVTPKTMAEAAAAGDENIRGAIVRAAQFLAIGVSNVMTALHPDLVVLGGGMAQIGDLLFETVREEAADRVRMFPTDTVDILPSKLGDRAGMLGGIALAMKGGLIND